MAGKGTLVRAWVGAALLAVMLSSVAAASPAAALPPLQTQGEIRYLSGGIGSDEAAAIQAAREQFALSISLSARSGGRDVYLATVPLTIRDDAGRTLLDVVSDGPYLLVQLPPGRYEIAARYGGETRTRVVQLVAGRPQRLALSWSQLTNEAANEAAAAPPSAAPTLAPATDAGTAARDPALPPVRVQGGVPYLSGGVGSEEAAAIQAAAARYSLALTLSANEDGRGVFLASIPVSVSEVGGATLLDVVTDGPYLLADLPPGRYVVRARYAEQEQTATVTVAPGRTARVSFAWRATAH
ncbi:carboxypeptidase-like regulatory domain-containing protein [Solimonas flava]|uniref:carboxypeptidase-like regulatory domain-containing protein n=1 Tax=Solimonas flava TaxID=415849 RepID=UPI00048A2B25|nr:carboxypeptidase-like regulatory domain-containing protein [Solimonas flava]